MRNGDFAIGICLSIYQQFVLLATLLYVWFKLSDKTVFVQLYIHCDYMSMLPPPCLFPIPSVPTRDY
jgi:hypothetical protein